MRGLAHGVVRAADTINCVLSISDLIADRHAKAGPMPVPDPPQRDRPRRIVRSNYQPEPQPTTNLPDSGSSWAEMRRQREGRAPQPATMLEPAVSVVAGYATLGARVVAYVIDIALVWGMLLAIFWLGSAVLHGTRDVGTDFLGALWTLLWPVGYFGALTSGGNRTIGMVVVRTRVLSTTGEPLSFWTACLRAILFLLGFVTIAPLLANCLLLVTDQRQGYHDKMTRAIVARE